LDGCETCGPGEYSDPSQSISCTECPKGSWPNETRNGCKTCATGEYSNPSANVPCSVCVENTFINLTLDGCVSCDIGYEYSFISGICFKCDRGLYSGPSSGYKCILCDVGFEVSELGDECVKCRDDEHSDNSTNWKCVENDGARSRSSTFPWWIFIIIASVVIIVVLILLFVLLKRKKKKKEIGDDDSSVNMSEEKNVEQTDSRREKDEKDSCSVSVADVTIETREDDAVNIKEAKEIFNADEERITNDDSNYNDNILNASFTSLFNLNGEVADVLNSLKIHLEKLMKNLWNEMCWSWAILQTLILKTF
jgi:hypothetical protein